MNKKYGLILPGQQKNALPVAPAKTERAKPSIFDESSDSDDVNKDGGNAPQLKMKAVSLAIAPSAMERRMARRMQDKALEEDPTVFQYDELYDDMEAKREEVEQSKSNGPKKPKYIGRLMEFAERRKLENELRIERQVQKEREAEGEQFQDKESFVTGTYRKKLEEMRKLEEQEKRDEYLETIGDVTKQKDLDGFYRHLYEQKMGTAKEVEKPAMPNTASGDEEISYKPIKSGKPQQRAYRKRHSSIEDEAQTEVAETKKVHLQNNIDADSDFTIDSSSDEMEEADVVAPQTKDAAGVKKASALEQIDSAKIALKLDEIKKETEEEASTEQKHRADENEGNFVGKETGTSTEIAKPKKAKSEIWKKRTVGAAFDEAVQRYFERKALRRA